MGSRAGVSLGGLASAARTAGLPAEQRWLVREEGRAGAWLGFLSRGLSDAALPRVLSWVTLTSPR